MTPTGSPERLPRPDPGVDRWPGKTDARSGPRHHLSMVARGGVLNLVGAASGGLLSFVVVVIVTRGLGPRRAGAFFVAAALFSVLAKTLELGADIGIVRAISRNLALGRAAETRRVLSIALAPVIVGGVLVGCLLWVSATDLAPHLARNFPPDALAPLLRALGALLPVAPVATVLLAGTRGFGTMVPTVVLDRLVRPLMQPVAILLVLAAGLGTTAVVIAWALPVALTVILAAAWLLVLVRQAERALDRSVDSPGRYGALARAFWRFSAPRGLAGLFQVAIAWVDTLMIGALRSAREAGIYTAATRYLLITSLTTLAIIQVVGPKLSELMAREDRPTANAVYQAATGWLILIAWPVNLTILLFTPVLLSLFGGSFRAGGAALAIVAGAALFATAVGPVDVVLLMAGKSTWNLANTALALLINIGLNLLLIPRLGIEGAAIAWAASIVTNNLLPLTQVRRGLGMHPFGRGTIRALTASSIAFGAVGSLTRLWLGATPLGFAVYAVVSGTAYVGLVWRYRAELELAVIGAAVRITRRGRPTAPEPSADVDRPAS